MLRSDLTKLLVFPTRRSSDLEQRLGELHDRRTAEIPGIGVLHFDPPRDIVFDYGPALPCHSNGLIFEALDRRGELLDRKSTRLNSSHVKISYAVFCLKNIRNQ